MSALPASCDGETERAAAVLQLTGLPRAEITAAGRTVPPFPWQQRRHNRRPRCAPGPGPGARAAGRAGAAMAGIRARSPGSRAMSHEPCRNEP